MSVHSHTKIIQFFPSTYELRIFSVYLKLLVLQNIEKALSTENSTLIKGRTFSRLLTETLDQKLTENQNKQIIQCILEHKCHEIRVRSREPFKQTFKTSIFAIYVFAIWKNYSKTICIHFDFVWLPNIPHKYLNAKKNGNLTRHIVKFTI